MRRAIIILIATSILLLVLALPVYAFVQANLGQVGSQIYNPISSQAYPAPSACDPYPGPYPGPECSFFPYVSR
jgi:hypothetical protein